MKTLDFKNNETTFYALLPEMIRRNSLILVLLCFATNESKMRAWDHRTGFPFTFGGLERFVLEF